MKEIRIGVVGLRRGFPYAKAYANEIAETTLVSVCENDLEYAESIKQELPENTQFFQDYDAFLNSGLDAIVLCNFFHEHAKFAIPALERGISVLSETTAAPTLGECVALCEAVERTGAKYMLAANVPHMYGCMEMDRLYQQGKSPFGRVLYAEGEYFHTSAPAPSVPAGTKPSYHWRKFLPRTYYDMHDFGTLMSITGLMPRSVNAKAVFAPDIIASKSPTSNVGDIASVILTEMDSGAIFRTTSCASLGPSGKWFRLACENGTIETVRGDQESIKYTYNSWSKPENEELTKTYDAHPEVVTESQGASGHGGSDYRICLAFVDYLKDRMVPFFDVYRSAALSAVGILAWRSVLEDGKGFRIPDFKDKEDRKAVADDFLTPFPNFADGSGITLPCSSKPYTRSCGI